MEFDRVCVSVLHKCSLVIIVTGSVDLYTGVLNPFFDLVPGFSYTYRCKNSIRNQVSVT